MKKPKQFTFLAAILLTLALTFIIALNYSSSKAPDITFATISGKKIALKELRGKPVIVTFWATNCPECVKEIPILIDLYQKYHRQGLEIIAVAMSYDPPNHVITLSEELQLPYDIALDLTGEQALAFGNVQLTPSTFLITPNGSINLKITGAFDSNKLKTDIKNLLKG